MTEVFTSPSRTSATRLDVPAPQALDVVDAAEWSDLIDRTTRELEALQQEADEVTASAAQAEDAARMVNVDAASTTWTLVRLQRFLEELRAEAERDAATMIEIARQHAQLRMEDSPAMAARGGPWVEPPTLAVPPPRPPAPVFVAADPVVPVVAAEPVVPVVAAEPVVPVVAAAPAAPAAPAVPLAPAAPPVPEAPIVPVVAVAPVVPEVPVAPVVAAVPPAPAVAEAVPTEPQPGPARPAKKRRGFKVLPFSALLEVLAVLLLLVFIVMRLS